MKSMCAMLKFLRQIAIKCRDLCGNVALLMGAYAHIDCVTLVSMDS